MSATTPPSPPAPPPALISRVSLALAALALLLAIGLPLLQPDALVTVYLVHVFPHLVAALAPLDRALPVPLVDLLEIATAALVLGTLGRLGFLAFKKRVSRRDAAIRAASGLLGLLSLIYLLGVMTGLYVVGRKTIEARLGLDPRTVTPATLVAAALKLNEPLTQARRALGNAPRFVTTRAKDWLGRGSTPDFPVEPADVFSASRAAVRDAVQRLEGRDWEAFSAPRAPVPDTLLHLYGVGGRTIPLFGEVCVSPYLSAIEYPVILTHEYAHSAGVIREREADFYAFVGGSRSPCALLRFSVFATMRSRLTQAAYEHGVSDAWDQVRAPLPPDLLQELDVLSDLYDKHAFAPGGVIEVQDSAATGEPEVTKVTEGEAPGTAPVAAFRAVSASAGLPPDYDSCLPLVALWVLGRGPGAPGEH